jgi:hypothetical protein
VVFPGLALHRELQALGIEFSGGIIAGLTAHSHESLLHKPGTDAPRAKPLAVKDVLQLHGVSAEHQSQPGRIVEHVLHQSPRRRVHSMVRTRTPPKKNRWFLLIGG